MKERIHFISIVYSLIIREQRIVHDRSTQRQQKTI